MTIKFYKNVAENNKVDKSAELTLLHTKSGALRADSSVVNPVISFTDSGEGGENPLRNSNYMYVEELARYYYITDIVNKGRLWEVHGRCDVLMTYKSDIRNARAIVARNEKSYNKKINDDSVVLYQKPYYLHRKNGFSRFKYLSNDGYVLAVAGSLGGDN